MPSHFVLYAERCNFFGAGHIAAVDELRKVAAETKDLRRVGAHGRIGPRPSILPRGATEQVGIQQVKAASPARGTISISALRRLPTARFDVD